MISLSLKIKDTAKLCVSSKTNMLNHSLICNKGDYVSMHHIYQIYLVSLITKLFVSAGCREVVTEPLLPPTARVTLPPGSNTADSARANVTARSIWNHLEREFLDVRLYHAQAPSNRNLKTVPRMYSHHEEQKKHAYNARILEVERGVCTPLRPVKSTQRQSPSSGRDCASTF